MSSFWIGWTVGNWQESGLYGLNGFVIPRVLPFGIDLKIYQVCILILIMDHVVYVVDRSDCDLIMSQILAMSYVLVKISISCKDKKNINNKLA